MAITLKNLKTNAGSIAFLLFQNTGFMLASAISAFLNIFLISNLDNSFKFIFIGASLTLEITKLISLIRANTLDSLYKKVRIMYGKKEAGSIKGKSIQYYIYYGFYAMFAIFAGVGFSLYVTSTTEQTYSVQENTIVQRIDDIKRREQEITDFELGDIIKYRTSYELEQEKWKAADDKDTDDRLTLRLMDRESEEYIPFQREVQARSQYLNTLGKNRDAAKLLWDQAINQLEQKRSELTQTLLAYGFNSRTELEIEQLRINNEKMENAGSSKVFILLANTFGVNEEKLKFFLLILISVLIELTIFQLSPDTKIDRKLLYNFRKALPDNINVDKVIFELDKELKRFSNREEIIEDKPNKPIINKTTKNKKETKSVFVPDLEKHPEDALPNIINEPIEQVQKEPVEQVQKEPEIQPELELKVQLEPKEIIQPELDFNQEDIEPLEDQIDKTSIIQTPVGKIRIDNTPKPTEKLNDSKVQTYRFGKATESIKDRFVQFITFLYDYTKDKRPFELNTIEYVVRKGKFSNKARDVFSKLLFEMKYGAEHLIYREDGKIKSKFDMQFIIDYTTELVGKF